MESFDIVYFIALGSTILLARFKSFKMSMNEIKGYDLYMIPGFKWFLYNQKDGHIMATIGIQQVYNKVYECKIR